MGMKLFKRTDDGYELVDLQKKSVVNEASIVSQSDDGGRFATTDTLTTWDGSITDKNSGVKNYPLKEFDEINVHGNINMDSAGIANLGASNVGTTENPKDLTVSGNLIVKGNINGKSNEAINTENGVITNLTVDTLTNTTSATLGETNVGTSKAPKDLTVYGDLDVKGDVNFTTPGEEGDTFRQRDGKITAESLSTINDNNELVAEDKLISTSELAKWNGSIAATEGESEYPLTELGSATVHGTLETEGNTTVNGNLTVTGNMYNQGKMYEVHAEEVFSKNDNIILRDGAETGLTNGQRSGIDVNNYDGNGSTLHLGVKSDGTARVGVIDSEGNEDLEPLLTRDESAGMVNKGLLYWDNAGQKAKTLEASDAENKVIVSDDAGGYVWKKYRPMKVWKGTKAQFEIDKLITDPEDDKYIGPGTLVYFTDDDEEWGSDITETVEVGNHNAVSSDAVAKYVANAIAQLKQELGA